MLEKAKKHFFVGLYTNSSNFSILMLLRLLTVTVSYYFVGFGIDAFTPIYLDLNYQDFYLPTAR